MLTAACTYYGPASEELIYAFDADADILELIAELMGRGGTAEFAIEAGSVDTAVAGLADSRRVLFYNQYAFATLQTSGREQWVALGILAHQVGHHVLGHTFTGDEDARRRDEVEADRYAGAALRRLGVSAENASAALSETHSVAGPESGYPPLSERRDSVASGWNTAERGDVVSAFDSEAPRFDWPPPRPSARAHVPMTLLVGSTGSRLGDAADTLEGAFDKAGYVDRSYYAIPRGFALVAQLEQINADGTPKAGEQRWSTKLGVPRVFSLDYVSTLLLGKHGRFRIVVFLVTAEPITHEGAAVDFDIASDWLWEGAARLPSSIGGRPLTESFACTALIYEFERRDAVAQTVIRRPSTLDGRVHLTKSGLWSALSR